MTIDEVLRAARAKIRLKKNWCQGAFARDASHRGTRPRSPNARQWCAVGAILAIAKTHSKVCDQAIATLDRLSKGIGVPNFNDHEGHAAVMRLFNAAISEEGKRGR